MGHGEVLMVRRVTALQVFIEELINNLFLVGQRGWVRQISMLFRTVNFAIREDIGRCHLDINNLFK